MYCTFKNNNNDNNDNNNIRGGGVMGTCDVTELGHF